MDQLASWTKGLWKVLRKLGIFGFYLVGALGLFTVRSSLAGSDNRQEIPYCPDEKILSTFSRSTIVVSTLDGRLTALDTDTGLELWSHTTEPGPLLSSTISDYKFSSQGKSVQLIPSLDGDLYTFDGEQMGGTPISSESLLSNTLRMSDDIVITGGKEIKTYGINRKTGQVLYSCGMDECKYSGSAINSDEVLVVRRMIRTVRAVSALTGMEKWNYSVGQHEANLASPFGSGSCHASRDGPIADDTEIKADIMFASAEGYIFVSNTVANRAESWERKFDSPIVRAWQINNLGMEQLDIFESGNNPNFESNRSNRAASMPLVYLGCYNKQLYIVQSQDVLKIMAMDWKAFGQDLDYAPPLVTWQPYLSTALSRTPVIHSKPPDDTSVVIHVKGESKNTAIGQAVGDYPFDSGFYFIITHTVNATPEKIAISYKEANAGEGDDDDDGIIGSLWYWWKEVLGISITFAILINVFITRHHINRIRIKLKNESSSQPNIVVIETVPVASDPGQPSNEMSKSNSTDASGMATPPADFVSRYFSDFEPVQTLGKGGFGVVFQARNKIDDCHYAIKRIAMSNKNDSKERIMREVKALAKLDHVGIVRYYNSWLESPPVNWQQPVDHLLDAGDVFTPSSAFTAEDLHNSFAPAKPCGGQSVTKEMMSTEESSLPSNNNVRDKNWKNSNHDRQNLSFYYDECAGDSLETLSKAELMDSGVIFRASKCDLSNESFIRFENSQTGLGDSCRLRSASLPASSYRRLLASSRNSTEDSFIQFKEPTANVKIDQSNSTERQLNDSGLLDEKQAQPSAPWPKCKSYLYIQMQLCRKESLKDWLRGHKDDRDRFETLAFFYQIISAVEYVHEQGLMHRDLKPSNIFFAMDGAIKIGDFGLVATMSPGEETGHAEQQEGQPGDVYQKHTNQVGTRLYMSPEQLAEETYDHKVDIFSLGLILFELLVPFSTEMERIQVMSDARDKKFPTHFIKEYSEECNLVRQMLSHSGKDRPCANEIKQHALLQDFQPRPNFLRHQRSRSMSRTYSTSSSNSSGNSGYGPAAGSNERLCS